MLYPKPKKKKKSKVDIWNTERARLKQEYIRKGKVSCEVQLEGCWRNNALSFAHRYKRNDPRCTHTYKGTLCVCIPCHMKLEVNKELTNYYFNKLR